MPMTPTRWLIACLLLAASPARAEEAAKPAHPKPDPEQVARQKAEDARYAGLPKQDRETAILVDKAQPKLMAAWVTLRDAHGKIEETNRIWGSKARKNAEKQKAKLERDLPDLFASYERLAERYGRSLERAASKARKAANELAELKPHSHAAIQAKRDAQRAELEAEVTRNERLIGLLGKMTTAFAGSSHGHRVADRLQLIGIAAHDVTIRQNIEDYESILEAVYEVRDHISDVETLEDRKTAGEGWDRRGDAALKSAVSSLERAAQKLERLAARDQADVQRDIDKLTARIARVDAKLKSVPEDSSSAERYHDDKWELEAEMATHQERLDKLALLADWKRLKKQKPTKQPDKPTPEAPAPH